MASMTTKFLALAAAMMMAGFALADGDGYRSPPAERYSMQWLGLFCLIVFLVATVVLGFKTAKRAYVD